MSAPFDLREFQAELARRIEAATARDNSGARIGFSAGGRNWLASLDDIQEVIALPPVTAVPGAKAWFLGMVNVRGNLYGVSDMAGFLGLGRTARAPSNRLLVPHARLGINAALLIQTTRGLTHLDQHQVHACENAPDWCRQTYRDAEGVEWHDLDLARFFANPAFLQVEQDNE